MNPYITFIESGNNGLIEYFILQREFPHFVCILSKEPIIKIVKPVPIDGYKLWVVFYSCLRGNVIPSYNDIDEELKVIMSDMSQWHLKNRILSNEKKYKKWKIMP